ncbi:tyrosine-type recombinase/integrase [Plantactinospora sp. B6F1]|uniref:tyrosine-type recombinase/integrase n=1 Tax=Plantactinospora sp. B6F1 TaxID=3158971 RepID=UPI0032D8D262
MVPRVGRLAGRGRLAEGIRGFHALRHFFATTLITNHAEPQEVQRLLRHKTLRITLETYVHWWPKRERPRGVIGSVLRSASARSNRTTTNQDQA